MFDTVFAPGDLSASTTGGEHPEVATSPLDPGQDLNRSWIVSGSFAFDSFDATLGFVSSDVDAGANTNAFVVAEYAGGAWILPTVGVRTAASTQATGATAFGAFAVGELAADLAVVQSALPPSVFVG